MAHRERTGVRRRFVVLSVLVVVLLGLGLATVVFPDYVRLLRPRVLKQLDPQVVALVNELPAVDKQNKEIIGRLFAHGGLAHAKARITLDGPGYYWFGCPVGNHVGRGMLGQILVKGDVPDEARLDRPDQPRP